MTRILVLGATGRTGSATLTELPPGVEVIAALRVPGDVDRLPTTRAIVAPHLVNILDTDSIRTAAEGADVIINAIRLREDIPATALVDLHQRIVAATDGNPLIATVGGAGSLHMPDGFRYWEHAAFPTRTLPRGRAHAILRDHLESGLVGDQWAYLIPPPAFNPDGPRSGDYQEWPASTDETTFARHTISYADFAIALADAALETTTGTHLIAA